MNLTTGSDKNCLSADARFLGGAAILAAAGTATADTPDWLTRAGEIVTPYGMPASTDITRAPIQPHPDPAHELSFSGTPLHKLRGTITPCGLHFEIYHGGRPLIDASKHELVIHGLVDNPIRINRTALERYPMVTRTHFVECAGNSFFATLFDEPQQVPLDLMHGLLSNSEWTGVPLRVLMEEAKVRPEGKWVVAIGNDAPNLARSIPMEKLMDD